MRVRSFLYLSGYISGPSVILKSGHGCACSGDALKIETPDKIGLSSLAFCVRTHLYETKARIFLNRRHLTHFKKELATYI